MVNNSQPPVRTQNLCLTESAQTGLLVSVGWAATGVSLLMLRILGSLPADGDSLRRAGLLLFFLGLGVLTRPLAQSREDFTPQGRLLCSLLTTLGCTLTMLAIFPGNSSALTWLLIPIVPAYAVWSSEPVLREFLIPGSTTATYPNADSPTSERSAPSDQNVVQWMTRKQTPDGQELVEGMAQLKLVPGQKQAAAHIVFSPALACAPEVECEPLADCEVDAVVSESFAHGFRIDLRRTTQTDQSAIVEIGFQAIAAKSGQEAA